MYGTALKELRKSKGWSQEKLSVESGVSVRMISQIETDKNLKKEPVIIKLIKLGLNVEGVICRTDEASNAG